MHLLIDVLIATVVLGGATVDLANGLRQGAGCVGDSKATNVNFE